MDRFSNVVYKLDLPADLASRHLIFHVSLLKKLIGDITLIVPIDSVGVNDSLSNEEVPIEIIDRQRPGNHLAYSPANQVYDLRASLRMKLQRGLLILHLRERVDEFLDNDIIVRSSSLGEETRLGIVDYGGKEGFNSIGNDFGDDLILGIANTNGPKVHQGGDLRGLKEKTTLLISSVEGIASRSAEEGKVESLGMIFNVFLVMIPITYVILEAINSIPPSPIESGVLVKSMFQVLKEVAGGLMDGLLDTPQFSQKVFLFMEDVSKHLFITGCDGLLKYKSSHSEVRAVKKDRVNNILEIWVKTPYGFHPEGPKRHRGGGGGLER
ncbi:hypothetical protein BC332_08930 [Capsicum chinense]|nr:hypothetical protein BC332_08930 [Capsicum chinense]